MTHKERVLTALGHKPTERVPLDFWATSDVTNTLIQHLRLPDEESLLRELDIDLRLLTPRPLGAEREPAAPSEYTDVWGVRRRLVSYGGGSYWEVSEYPLASVREPADLKDYAVPDPAAYDFEGLKRRAEKLQEYAVVLYPDRLNRTSLLKGASYLRGFEQFLMDLVLAPPLARSILAILRDYYLRHNEHLFEATRGLADIFLMGDDFGSQRGLILSLDMWREFLRETLEEFVAQAHSYGLRVIFHSCGDVRSLIPDLIEIGVDVLNPLQRTGEMDIEEIKATFGSRLSFHGAIDVQRLLPFAPEATLREEVRKTIATLGRGGGYILCSSHNIQSDTPIRNVLALYDEARRFRIAD